MYEYELSDDDTIEVTMNGKRDWFLLVDAEYHPNISKSDLKPLARILTSTVDNYIAMKKSALTIPKKVIIENNECVLVKDSNDNELLKFYWDPTDRWKYGISNKEEAINLAEKFVALYESDLPWKPSENPNNYVRHSMATWDVYINNRYVAKFMDKNDAIEYLEKKAKVCISQKLRVFYENLTPKGFVSAGRNWVCSITNEGLSDNDFRYYLMLLLDWVDEIKDSRSLRI